MFIRMIVFLYVTEIQLDSQTDEYKMTKRCYVFKLSDSETWSPFERRSYDSVLHRNRALLQKHI